MSMYSHYRGGVGSGAYGTYTSGVSGSNSNRARSQLPAAGAIDSTRWQQPQQQHYLRSSSGAPRHGTTSSANYGYNSGLCAPTNGYGIPQSPSAYPSATMAQYHSESGLRSGMGTGARSSSRLSNSSGRGGVPLSAAVDNTAPLDLHRVVRRSGDDNRYGYGERDVAPNGRAAINSSARRLERTADDYPSTYAHGAGSRAPAERITRSNASRMAPPSSTSRPLAGYTPAPPSATMNPTSTRRTHPLVSPSLTTTSAAPHGSSPHTAALPIGHHHSNNAPDEYYEGQYTTSREGAARGLGASETALASGGAAFYAGGASSTSSPTVRPTCPSSALSPTAPVGFRNMGNTCYLNAAVQALIASPNFIEGIVAHYAPPSSSLGAGGRRGSTLGATNGGGAITEKEVRAVPRGMAKDLAELVFAGFGGYGGGGSSSVSPILSSIKSKCSDRNCEFDGARQNDSHELLRVLMLLLHEQMNRVKGKPAYVEMKDIDGESAQDASQRWWDYHLTRDDSLVYDLFGGQTQSVVECKRCARRSYSYDPFWDLFLRMSASSSEGGGSARGGIFSSSSPTSTKIELLLAAFTGAVRLEGADRYYCSRCKSAQDSTQQTTIMRFPKLLTLSIVRFDRRGRKDSTPVSFGESLKIPPSCSYEEGPSYELYSIVVHSGSVGYGHYYAYVKKGRDWFRCDDSTITRVAFKVVQQESAGVYVLFYSRADFITTAQHSFE